MSELTLNVITDFLKKKGYNRFAVENTVNDYEFQKIDPKTDVCYEIYICMTPSGWTLYSDTINVYLKISRLKRTFYSFEKERNELTETCKELYKMGVLAIGKYGGK